MFLPQLQPLPWAGGPLAYAAGLEQKVSRLFCFYSGAPGRFSYVGFNPQVQIEIYPEFQKVLKQGESQEFRKNPFDLLKKYTPYACAEIPSPYFKGGWLGFLSYEMAPFADPSFSVKDVASETLLGWWAYYDSILVFDHVEKQAYLSSLGNAQSFQETKRCVENLSVFSRPIPSSVFKTSQALQSFESYSEAIQKILNYLRAGDCYQVNYTQAFEVELLPEISPFTCFNHLAEKHPAPFSAFLDAGEKQILSFSPEEFISLKNREVLTRPIKGSRRRVQDQKEDEKNIQELLNSPKDHAELLMIIDLLRNDLGKCCEYGSIKTSSLGELESYDYVHHRVATLRGILKAGLHPLDLVRELFPGGSITGAPKKRAMEIIQNLELRPRGVYTGAIGFIGDSLMQFNIAIRTLELYGEKGIFGVGGGIVIESDLNQEYEECLVKAKVFE